MKLNYFKSKMSSIQTIAMFLVFVFAFMCLSIVATAMPASDVDRIRISDIKYSDLILNTDGSWNANTRMSNAAIGESEHILLKLDVGDNVQDNEKFEIKIESDALDLSNAKTAILVYINGNKIGSEPGLVYYTKGPAGGSSKLTIEFTSESIFKTKNSDVYIYLTAIKKSVGSVNAKLEKKLVTSSSFAGGETVHVGSYAISKQSRSNGKVQLPAGMSGVANLEEAFIIHSGGYEIVRIMIIDGQVLGLAYRSDQTVYGLEFDVSNRLYQNSVTKKAVMTKDEMQEVFNDLDFSFLRAPNEKKWLDNQDAYASSSSFIIK